MHTRVPGGTSAPGYNVPGCIALVQYLNWMCAGTGTQGYRVQHCDRVQFVPVVMHTIVCMHTDCMKVGYPSTGPVPGWNVSLIICIRVLNYLKF